MNTKTNDLPENAPGLTGEGKIKDGDNGPALPPVPEENIEAPEHSSWIQDALDKIDTEFPLSGGETNEDLEQVLS